MSKFNCPVVRVAAVEEHPNADRLSIVRLEGLGYLCISNKLEDGSPRYRPGDFVVYIPSASVLPEWLLKDMGFWNEDAGKGMLAGSGGDRVKPLKLRGIFSEGVLYPATVKVVDSTEMMPEGYFRRYWQLGLGESSSKLVMRVLRVNDVADIVGHDVSTDLGITKWEPPIPVAMAGEVASVAEAALTYDFERWESVPDIFDPGEVVVATEKLHGCLHHDSMVMLPNGEQVSIAEIVQGNYTHVLSYDIDNHDYIARKITGKMRRSNIEKKTWMKLGLENGKTLTLTSDHPVYSRDRKMWIEAGKILPMEDIESPII